MPERVAASVDTSDVRSAFYEQVAVDDRYWWWIHQVYLEPKVVIADDEQGEFWLVPYSLSTDGVEFEDPVQVYIQWVETESGEVKASNGKTVNLPEHFGKPAQLWAAAKDSRPTDRQVEWDNKNPEKGKEAKAAVAIDITALRAAAGLSEAELPDDATEEQINTALAAKSESAETEVEETDVEAEPEPEADADVKASGTVVDKAAWEETTKYVKEQKAKERETFVKDAVKAGKIPPSRKGHYLSLMQRDEAGTREFLNSLEAGTIPVDERGHGEDAESATSNQGTGLFPKLEARRARQEV